MAPRDRNFLQFVPPNLRPALSEAGRVGYNILDNIIGYDDGYDTTGELLARSLREDPLGTLGAMGGGLYEGVKTAVTEPVQTARNVADEFTEAFLRLREPLPEFASREDIAQRTSDLSILGAIIPGVRPAVRTVGAVGQIAARAIPGRRTGDPTPDAAYDPWSNLDFDDGSEPPEDWLDDIVFGQDPDAALAAAVDPAPTADPVPAVVAPPDFQQTPFVFDPNDVPDPFDTDGPQPTDAQIAQFQAEQAALNAGTNPWTNVQGAEDLAAAYRFDPLASPYGVPVPDLGPDSRLFSPATRAAVSLEQPRYGSVDEVISNLRRQGATSMEIDLLRDQGVFDNLASEAELTGAIAKDSVIEVVGSAPRLNRSDFTVGRGAQYQRLFPPGAENYRESVFSFAQQPSAYSGPYYQGHFEQVPNAVFHMRTGELPTQEGGRAFHVGEIQSDLSRQLRGISQDERDYNRPLDMSPLEWRISVLQRKGDREAEFLKLDEEIKRTTANYQPGFITDEVEVLEREQAYLRNLIERDNNILQQMIDEGDAAQYFGLSTYSSRFEGGDASEVTGPVPIARDTNDYNTAAIARAFADAVESGADFLTFNTGDMMYQFSGGRLSGQRKAYDDILPRNVENYARRLAEEYDIDPPAIERVTLRGRDEDYNVPGIRMTPELRALIQTQGLPSYRFGGIVSLMRK